MTLFNGLSDLQLGDQKVTLNHLVDEIILNKIYTKNITKQNNNPYLFFSRNLKHAEVFQLLTWLFFWRTFVFFLRFKPSKKTSGNKSRRTHFGLNPTKNSQKRRGLAQNDHPRPKPQPPRFGPRANAWMARLSWLGGLKKSTVWTGQGWLPVRGTHDDTSGKTAGLPETHRIHVWYIYLHLVDFYGKCRHTITWMLWERPQTGTKLDLNIGDSWVWIGSNQGQIYNSVSLTVEGSGKMTCFVGESKLMLKLCGGIFEGFFFRKSGAWSLGWCHMSSYDMMTPESAGAFRVLNQNGMTVWPTDRPLPPWPWCFCVWGPDDYRASWLYLDVVFETRILGGSSQWM